MKETIHILMKDLRRFSAEIVLSLGLLMVFAWCAPAMWVNPAFSAAYDGASALRMIGGPLLGVLLVFAWMVLLIRLIYEDSPAGDRQFWVTRPYHWPSLLGAKVLFAAAVIHLPLLLVQFYLLALAKFAPLEHLPRLISMHMYLAVFFLCVGVLAVVTGAGTQLARAGIVLLLFLIILLVLSSRGAGFTSYGIDIGSPEVKGTVWDWMEMALLTGVALLVIVRQYALRKTNQARWLLLGGVVVFTVLSVAEPRGWRHEAEYPLLANSEAHFRMVLEQGKSNAALAYFKKSDNKVPVYFHLAGTGTAPGEVIRINAINITLQAPDGAHWNSGWRSLYGVFSAEDGQSADPSRKLWQELSLPMEADKSFVDHAKEMPVTVHIITAATLFRDKEGPPISPQGGDYIVPGIGFCAEWDRRSTALWCRTVEKTVPMVAATHYLFTSCPQRKDDLSGAVRLTSAWYPYRRGGVPGLSPVDPFFFYFGEEKKEGQPLTRCAGAPFSFHYGEKIRQFRMEQDFKDVKLDDLVVKKEE